MVVSESRKYAFVSSIKCGTNTMYEFLTKHMNGTRLDGDFHRSDCESYINRGFYVFTTVRDPYERAMSLWTSMIQRAHANGHDRYGLIRSCPDALHRFEPFAKWLASEWSHQPQRSLKPLAIHHMQTHVQSYVKLEELRVGFSRLPIVQEEEAIMIRCGQIPFSSRNSSNGFRPDKGISKEACAILKPWAGIDCEKYGYPVR